MESLHYTKVTVVSVDINRRSRYYSTAGELRSQDGRLSPLFFLVQEEFEERMNTRRDA